MRGILSGKQSWYRIGAAFSAAGPRALGFQELTITHKGACLKLYPKYRNGKKTEIMKNPILVTGASGVLGRSVVTAFAGAGLPVRQAVRNLKKAKPGVDSVRLDYSEPATIGPALTGIGGLLLMAPSLAETFWLFLRGPRIRMPPRQQIGGETTTMFYEIEVPGKRSGNKNWVAALVVLNPSESRRLLAKATVALPEVQHAWRHGTIIIGRGITNAYVTEELLGIRIEPKAGLTFGMICSGMTTGNSGPPACSHHVIREGKVVEGADSNVEILSFGPDDVFIKGANAIDPEGNAGHPDLLAQRRHHRDGRPRPTPRGSHLILPVGLEKLIPSVIEAARHSGVYYFKYSMGLPARLTPVVLGQVLTQIQALAVLTGVKATHLSSGGVGGSEGAVALSIEGEEPAVDKAFESVKSIKGVSRR